jgi:hypothetical protein
MIKPNLFWVVPRQLIQSVPTLKVTLINHSKKGGVRGQFDLKKPLVRRRLFLKWHGSNTHHAEGLVNPKVG